MTQLRRRLEQFVHNPRCEANALSAAHDIPMATALDPSADAQSTPAGQSPFALSRGVSFEQSLFADNAASLVQALVREDVLPATPSPTVYDLRLRKHGGPHADLASAASAFTALLTCLASPEAGRAPSVVLAATLTLPEPQPDELAWLAIDVLTVHPSPEPNGPTALRVGEVKAWADRGGHSSRVDLATARAQAGLYVHALREALRTRGHEPALAVADDGFLVLLHPRFGGASVRAGEDLRWQARRAATAYGRLLTAAATRAPEKAEKAGRTALLRAAPTRYEEECAHFCERAPECRAKALASGDATPLGHDVARLLGPIPLPRALALLESSEPAANDVEAAFQQRVATSRELGRLLGG